MPEVGGRREEGKGEEAVRVRFLCQKPQSKCRKRWLPVEFPLKKAVRGRFLRQK